LNMMKTKIGGVFKRDLMLNALHRNEEALQKISTEIAEMDQTLTALKQYTKTAAESYEATQMEAAEHDEAVIRGIADILRLFRETNAANSEIQQKVLKREEDIQNRLADMDRFMRASNNIGVKQMQRIQEHEEDIRKEISDIDRFQRASNATDINRQKKILECEEALNKNIEEITQSLGHESTDIEQIGAQATQNASFTETFKKDQSSIANNLKLLLNDINYFTKTYSSLTQTMELLRGDYATLSEAIRIPLTQPFPKPTTDYTLAGQALEKLLSDYTFKSVLDIGCGSGQHTKAFLKAHKDVSVVDIYESDFMREHKNDLHAYIGDFNTYPLDIQFDCVWASHVLEHQPNPNLFLLKVHSVLKEGGVLAVTVPPPRNMIGGGHVSLWNPGLLLYHLVLAGFDCHEAHIMRYGYNLSVLLNKRTIDVRDKLVFNAGDIKTIAPFLPAGIPYAEVNADYTFDGNLNEMTHLDEK
jgi:SAM-dependent methyltransferase